MSISNMITPMTQSPMAPGAWTIPHAVVAMRHPPFLHEIRDTFTRTGDTAIPSNTWSTLVAELWITGAFGDRVVTGTRSLQDRVPAPPTDANPSDCLGNFVHIEVEFLL